MTESLRVGDRVLSPHYGIGQINTIWSCNSAVFVYYGIGIGYRRYKYKTVKRYRRLWREKAR